MNLYAIKMYFRFPFESNIPNYQAQLQLQLQLELSGYILIFPSHPATHPQEKYGMTSGMKHATPTLTPSFLYNINYNF